MVHGFYDSSLRSSCPAVVYDAKDIAIAKIGCQWHYEPCQGVNWHRISFIDENGARTSHQNEGRGWDASAL